MTRLHNKKDGDFGINLQGMLYSFLSYLHGLSQEKKIVIYFLKLITQNIDLK